MLNKRVSIIIVSVLVLIVLAGFVYYFLIHKDKKVISDDLRQMASNMNNFSGQLPDKDSNQSSQRGFGEAQDSTRGNRMTGQENDIVQAESVASFFVEMMGTYSPDARFENILDLKSLMTVEMQRWADDFIDRNLPNIDDNNERMTTKVFKADSLSYSGNGAVIITYARREKVNNQGEKIYNQEAKVDLIKINGAWKVNKVTWK